MSENTRTTHFQISLPPEQAKAIAKAFMLEQGANEDYADNNLRSRTAVYQQLKQWTEASQV